MINQPFDQQIDNAESLGLKQLAQMQQTNPDFAQAIAFENLKQSLLAHQNQTDMDNRPMGQPADVIGRNELEVREMLAGMGAPTEPTQMGQEIRKECRKRHKKISGWRNIRART